MTKPNAVNRETNKAEEIRQKAMFNAVTKSVKPENQNQEHNTKKVSYGPNTQR
ncbi:hypothetical protein [Caproiciproducens sp. LBM24188]|nr:hypothetical protein [Clostridiales bacterium]